MGFAPHSPSCLSYTYTYCNGAKLEYVMGGKEISNVDDVVTKGGRHDEFTIMDRVRGLGERRLRADEHKVNYVSVGPLQRHS